MLRKNPKSETLASVACPKLSATERRDVEDLIHALLDLEVWGLKVVSGCEACLKTSLLATTPTSRIMGSSKQGFQYLDWGYKYF